MQVYAKVDLIRSSTGSGKSLTVLSSTTPTSSGRITTGCTRTMPTERATVTPYMWPKNGKEFRTTWMVMRMCGTTRENLSLMQRTFLKVKKKGG